MRPARQNLRKRTHKHATHMRARVCSPKEARENRAPGERAVLMLFYRGYRAACALAKTVGDPELGTLCTKSVPAKIVCSYQVPKNCENLKLSHLPGSRLSCLHDWDY